MSAKSRRPSRSAMGSESLGDAAGGQRLQKVLAAAGIASRRECETLILEGRVEVDRNVVTVLGTRVDPRRQEIRVDGTPLTRRRWAYYVVNKPAGVVCTNRDPDGRPRVIDLVPTDQRLFTVGRLDRSSEGMILVTNDGELANQLSHPRYGIPKTYRAKVLGQLSPAAAEKLRKGVHLAEGPARVASLKVRGRHERGSELEIVLTEGRNREIRRVLARVGHKVLYLKRIAIGPLRLGNLAPGECRRLKIEEVDQLRRHVQRLAARSPAARGGRPAARRPGTIGGDARGRGPRAGKPSTRRKPAGSEAGRPSAAGKPRPLRDPKAGTKQEAARKLRQRKKPPTGGTVLDYDTPAKSGAEGQSRPARKKPARKRKRR